MDQRSGMSIKKCAYPKRVLCTCIYTRIGVLYRTIIQIIIIIRDCEKKSSLQNLAAGVWLVFSIGFYIPIQTPTWRWTTMPDMCNNMCECVMCVCEHICVTHVIYINIIDGSKFNFARKGVVHTRGRVFLFGR